SPFYCCGSVRSNRQRRRTSLHRLLFPRINGPLLSKRGQIVNLPCCDRSRCQQDSGKLSLKRGLGECNTKLRDYSASFSFCSHLLLCVPSNRTRLETSSSQKISTAHCPSGSPSVANIALALN